MGQGVRGFKGAFCRIPKSNDIIFRKAKKEGHKINLGPL